MSNIQGFLKAFVIFLVFKAVMNASYNYGDKGPDAWPKLYTECKGKQQSPINIQDCKAIYDASLAEFNLINYTTNMKWNISYSKYTIIVTPSTSNLKMSGSNLDTTFTLLQFHFHWGENEYQGSEHYIDGVKYPAEVHFVHKSGDKFAVLGFMFQLSDNDNPNLYGLLNATHSVSANKTKLMHLNVSAFLPEQSQLKNYYRYTGSLTTPPCTEGIIWTVFETPILISKNQLKSFRTSKTHRNFREPQKIYKRTVYSSRKERIIHDSDECHTPAPTAAESPKPAEVKEQTINYSSKQHTNIQLLIFTSIFYYIIKLF